MIEYFFVIGLTLFIGFIANIISDKTKITTVLILMTFGFFLGPIFGIIDASPGSSIAEILPFVAVLTLIILLFDGGMMMEVTNVISQIPRSALFTFLTFIITTIVVALFCMLVLGWPFLHGALLGAALGGTSSAIVIAMAEKAGITKPAVAFLTVESTITDALCIIGAMLVLQFISDSVAIDMGGIGHILLSMFILAAFIGAVLAIIWIVLVRRFRIYKYNYMLTLGLAFVVYAAAEYLGANGGFSVFIFGLTLGNARNIASYFKINTETIFSPLTLKKFQEEVTFFVRTFFFVYAGLLFSPEYFTPFVILITIGVSLIMLFSRKIGDILLLRKTMEKDDRNVMVAMMPRGLAAAVLASFPVLYGLNIPEFQPVVFGVIVVSNLIATAGIFLFGGEDPLWYKIAKRLDKTILFLKKELDAGKQKPEEKSPEEEPEESPEKQKTVKKEKNNEKEKKKAKT